MIDRSNGQSLAGVGSAADRAGVRSGDLVVAVNGVAVHSGTQLRNAIGLARIGDEIMLTIDRRGAERTISVRVEQAPVAATRGRQSEH